jgi:hypothetical protein
MLYKVMLNRRARDIDLLRCRSFCVSCKFLDSEVLDLEFKENLGKILEVLMPFVHW